MLRLGVLIGDDIGLEVVPQCVAVMAAACRVAGQPVEWIELPIGKTAHEQYGHTFPPVTAEALRALDGWVLGPIGHAAYPRNDPNWVFPPIRKVFDLYASIKPVKTYRGLPAIHDDVDIVFLREVTEGLQNSDTVIAGAGEFRPNDEITIASRVITRKGSRRMAEQAFAIARKRRRKRVTAVHKEPIYRLACGMFAEECRKVAAQYPDVKFDEVMVDTAAMKLVMKPQQFDVVVTTNQFGDILTDEGAGLVGGLGLAPGICAGDRQAMAQATHGSAPDIAGKDIANPFAMIMSGKMLLDWLGNKHDLPTAVRAAELIETAMAEVVQQKDCVTPDIGGSAGTRKMGEAIVNAIGGVGG